MKALILAAGQGTRMGALTANKPKCLVEFGGRSLLSRQMESLKAGGCDELAIVTGHGAQFLQSYGAILFHNADYQKTNMVASLMTAADWFKDNVIVSYGDIFYKPQIIFDLMRADADIAIAYDVNWKALWLARFGDAYLDDAETFAFTGNQLTAIGARSKNPADINGQYMGLLKFTPKGWDIWTNYYRSLSVRAPEGTKNGQDKIDMTMMLNGLLKTGQRIAVVPNTGDWGESDSATDLEFYQKKFG